MTQAEAKEFKIRRHDRYMSFFESIKSFIEMAEEYECKEANEILKDVATMLKEFTIKSKINGEEVIDGVNYLLSLDIGDKDKDFFVNHITNGVRTAGEYLIALELKQQKGKLIETYLEDAIEYVEEWAKPKYNGAVNLLVQLAKIKKLNKLNNIVFEIEKDLMACLDYNQKIEIAQNDSNVIPGEISDEFMEVAEKEEEMVEV